jgi:hypothetical protein
MQAENQFMPDADPRTRIQVMQDTAEKIEETEYLVPLTQEALDLKREQFTDNSIWIGERTATIKEIVAEHKEAVKPKAEENAKLLQEITTRQEKKSGTLYHLPNYETGFMATYDQNGDLVGTRRLRPEEKKGQSKLFIPSSGFVSKAINE